jgi:Putative, 10TM heavy-metal exporter
MLAELGSALTHAAMITAFVAVMMISVEYLNVLTHGTFEAALQGSPSTQYLAAAVLGAIPGCLGAFTVVALYSHRVVTVGAVVACMIATSGDEAFVMLALFPHAALWLTLGLAVLGFLTAPLVDRLAGPSRFAPESCARMTIHAEECRCFSVDTFLHQWRQPLRSRVFLALGLGGYLGWIVVGGSGLPGEWNWVRVTLLLVSGFGLFVVSTVPDHFLSEHLWHHVTAQHVPRIFAWTAGVLVGVALLQRSADLGTFVRTNPWVMLAAAGLIGLIPESGPHLAFASLYAAGGIPISILTTSSIVQDGHGMLPLLAQSRRDFLRVKTVNLVVGLAVGAAMLALGV